MKFNLKLVDVLTTFVIALVFGVLYKVWGPLYSAVAPLGLHLDQFIYGFWFVAAIVAALVIRKPGVAFLAETAAASGELLAGSQFGIEVLIYGVLQGLFAELVFAAFRYRKFNLFVAVLASLSSCLISLVLDGYKGYIGDLEQWNLITFVVIRFAGTIVFSAYLGYQIAKSIEKTGVTKHLRPIQKTDEL